MTVNTNRKKKKREGKKKKHELSACVRAQQKRARPLSTASGRAEINPVDGRRCGFKGYERGALPKTANPRYRRANFPQCSLFYGRGGDGGRRRRRRTIWRCSLEPKALVNLSSESARKEYEASLLPFQSSPVTHRRFNTNDKDRQKHSEESLRGAVQVPPPLVDELRRLICQNDDDTAVRADKRHSRAVSRRGFTDRRQRRQLKTAARTFVVVEGQLERVFQQRLEDAVGRRQESWIYGKRSGHFLHTS